MMTRLGILVCFVMFALVFFQGVQGAQANTGPTEKIAIVVNDDAISTSDVNARMKMILISSGLPDKPDVVEKLKPQVMQSLVEEQLRLQAAEKEKITVSDDEIESGFATIAAQNNFKPDQFKEIIKKSGIDVNTMRRQIKAQIAWTKLVQTKIQPQILISQSDIDTVLNRYQQTKGQNEYLLAEIFLPFEQGTQESNIKELADKLDGQIRAGAVPFFKVAQQFSKSAGAVKGGDLGWVPSGQLDPDVQKILSSMDKGQLSKPVRTVEGYHIYLLREKRTISDETIPSRQQIEYELGMERLDRAQQRRLLDLKSAAFIDYRV